MIDFITSAQNAKVKLAASLKQKKYRDEHGLFLAEGIRLCEEAVKSAWPLSFCLYSEAQSGHERLESLLAALDKLQVPVYQVSKAIYDKVSDTKEPQGILLVVEKSPNSLDSFIGQNHTAFLLVLDGLQDPGNVGAIIRTADAAGCTGVILTENTADLFSAKTIRATMGSVFHLPVIEMAASDALAFLKEHNIRLYAAALDKQAKSHFSVDFTRDIAVVLGNEGSGVQQAFLYGCDEKIFIPMFGEAESLNVSIAAAVISYEGVRQRHNLNS